MGYEVDYNADPWERGEEWDQDQGEDLLADYAGDDYDEDEE